MIQQAEPGERGWAISFFVKNMGSNFIRQCIWALTKLGHSRCWALSLLRETHTSRLIRVTHAFYIYIYIYTHTHWSLTSTEKHEYLQNLFDIITIFSQVQIPPLELSKNFKISMKNKKNVGSNRIYMIVVVLSTKHSSKC